MYLSNNITFSNKNVTSNKINVNKQSNIHKITIFDLNTIRPSSVLQTFKHLQFNIVCTTAKISNNQSGISISMDIRENYAMWKWM